MSMSEGQCAGPWYKDAAAILGLEDEGIDVCAILPEIGSGCNAELYAAHTMCELHLHALQHRALACCCCS